MTLELVFDFDGTITEDDSIAWVLDAALSYHKANSSPETYHSLANSWRRVVESYVADLDAYHRCFCPATQADDSTPLDVARNHFSNDQRRQIERASLSRVQDAGLFCGVPLEYLFQSGHKHREQGTIKLRRGFPDLVHLIRSHSAVPEASDVQILSVNWSASYIRGVLTQEDISSVIANDINPADGSISALSVTADDNTSEGWPNVLTVGSDKLSALRCLYRRQQRTKPGLPVEIVYFGDSTTDLECLLEFGGIVISPEAGISGSAGDLLRVLRAKLNYHVPHVFEYKGEQICWAIDFTEIKESSFLQKRVANIKCTKAWGP
ncbi:hypothetical protein N8I77_003853 [Diaporthe amygdali]|uniref:Haloacid dehalogenase-like hydrolase n=1 Tax=Phomopsis amygdali TaxID=1214568 RepID=A0AAD9SJR4_PHOAM|nr:hypothetical protein N8I77_003853 [Diaporthe amygdali]